MAGDLVVIDRPAAELVTRVTPPAPVLAYLARLRSDASRVAMRSKLDQAARLLSGGRADALGYPWHALTPAHVAALAAALVSDRARPAGPYAARTVNATMAAVRGVLRECRRAGLVTPAELADLIDVRREPEPSDPHGRGLDHGELAALYAAAAADPDPLRGARDAAMLAVLYGAGLRAGEAVALDVADFAPDDGGAHALTVRRGKGRKARVVPLPAGAVAAVGAWIHAAELEEAGPMLRSVRHGAAGGRMSTRAVGRACARLADAAAVRPFNPHDCRRTYIGALLDAGADLATVQKLAGHSDPATTARYDRRPAEVRRRAAAALAVPYRRRG